MQDAPPSFQEHQKHKYEYNPVKDENLDTKPDNQDNITYPTINLSQDKQPDQSITDKFGEAMAPTQLILLQTDELKNVHVNTTNDTNKVNKPSELNRVSSFQRVHSFHQDTLHKTTQGFDRISSGWSSVGSFEVLLIIGVLFSLLCYATAIYGIYSGNELRLMWSQYTPEDINTNCQGKYRSEFTYVKNRKRKDIGTKFLSMLIMGSIEIALFVILWCYSCITKVFNERCREFFVEGGLYTWVIGYMFTIAWFVFFINCLQFYNDVMEYCDEESMIYQDTEEIFLWFYPLVIFEIVKGSVMSCVLCSCMFWIKCIKD